jgi:hypothetical protein
LTHLNHSLLRVLRSSGDFIFVTAGYAVVDLVRGELRYAQAGHPAPLVWRAAACAAGRDDVPGALVAAARDFGGGRAFSDDVCVLMVRAD